jgi:hypothetical protein
VLDGAPVRTTTAGLLAILLTSAARAQTPAVEEVIEEVTPVPPAALTPDKHLRFEDREVGPAEFFTLTGRQDLAERSRSNVRRRIILAVAGSAVLIGTFVPGIYLLATVPDSESARCQMDQAYFNEVCSRQKAEHTIAGTALLAAGGLLGFGLLTIAYWTLPEVFKPFELREYIDGYNRKHATKAGVSVRLSPVATLTGGGLALEGRF